MVASKLAKIIATKLATQAHNQTFLKGVLSLAWSHMNEKQYLVQVKASQILPLVTGLLLFVISSPNFNSCYIHPGL